MLPHILFYDPFVSHSTTKKTGVEAQKAIKKKLFLIFYLCFIESNKG